MMTNDPETGRHSIYQIKIKGHLDNEWSEWFEGMTIEPVDGSYTIMTGPVVDDASLHGLLKKIRDLGLPLISVNRVEPGQPDAASAKPQSNDA